MAEALRLLLADVADVGEVGEPDDFVVHRLLAAGEQAFLKLRRAVEMILKQFLAAVRDDENVRDAGAHRLLHDVLNRGLVDDREHLLGHGLGSGQYARAEACGRDNGLSDFLNHSVPSLHPAPQGAVIFLCILLYRNGACLSKNFQFRQNAFQMSNEEERDPLRDQVTAEQAEGRRGVDGRRAAE